MKKIMIGNEESDPAMHKHLLAGWRFKMLLLTILISIIGYFLFTLWAGWHNVVAATSQIGLWGITLALLLSFFNFSLRFLRWRLFLKTLGYTLPLASSFKIYMSGFSLTTTPGKSGEALRGVFLKDYGIPFRKSFGIFFAERFFDLLSVVILSMSAIWIYPEAHFLLGIVVAVLGSIIFIVKNEHWLKVAERTLKKVLPQRFEKGIEFLLETAGAFRHCFSLSTASLALLMGIIAWAAEGLALYYLAYLMGYPIDLITGIFIYAFSLVIGGITMLPGGLGGAEVTMLKLLIVNAVPTAAAVALTLIIRLTSLWFSVFLGLIALPKKQIIWR